MAVEAGVPSKGKERAAREVTPQVLLQQLQMLRGDLTALNLDKDGESSEAGLRTLTSGGSSAELIEKLGKPSPEPAEASAAAAQPASGPSTAREPASEAALEKRLADLERLIGANEADVEEVSPTSKPVFRNCSPQFSLSSSADSRALRRCRISRPHCYLQSRECHTCSHC